MSLEGASGEADRAGPHSQELNRRFRRPEMPSTPPSAMRQLPKVLSHITKQSVEAEKPKHSAPVTATTNGVTTRCATMPTQHEEVKTAQRESESPPSAAVTLHSEEKAAPERLIGLDLLQEQVRRLALRKGFTLNIMVVGRSGLGKSTLINTLFRSSVLPRGVNLDLAAPGKTTQVRTTKTVIQENGVRLDLTVTDTPGFGDLIDNTDCWEPAVCYVNEQYEKYLLEELSPARTRWIRDTRVHCCLYFISPTGHGLRPLDLEVLRRLHRIVNVIPVIAKADTLTLEEREEFKLNIRNDLAQNQIETYPLAKYDHQEDFEVNQSYRKMTPFAVVGSEQSHRALGRVVLGRQNKWGLVEIENPSHCEFHHLRDLLIRSRMQDLIELTSSIHYEAFRRHRLLETNGNVDLSSLNESQI